MDSIIPITLVAILASFLLSLGLNRLLISHGARLGLMDHPGERRVHHTPIPRAGGLAIWLTFLAVAFAVALAAPEWFSEFQADWLIPFAAASLILVLVGLVDDSVGMKAWWKLLGQISAAATFFILRPDSHGTLLGYETPVLVNGVIFVIWAIMLINAFNLIDGLDGLCGGLALIALVALGVLAAGNGHHMAMAMMFIMAAAVMGFMRFNLNPARIFLGDTGSMILGFFIAAAATQTTGKRAILGSILLPIAVAGVPLLDVLLAIWRRSARKLLNQWTEGKRVGIFDADKDHLHHRFLVGRSQKKVTRLLHALATLLTLVAFLPLLFGDHLLGLSVIALLVLVLIGLRTLARVELIQTGTVLHLALKRLGGNRGLRVAAFGYDFITLTACALLAGWLESGFYRYDFTSIGSVKLTVMFVLSGMTGVYLSKAYRRVWSRVSLRDLAGVMICVSLAGLTCAVTSALIGLDFSAVRVSLIATTFAVLAIPIPRCFVDLLRELAMDAGHRRFNKHDGASERHVMVYGAGDLGNLFVDYLKICPPAHFKNFRVVGFIDENPDLKSRIMRGFPVLGNMESVEALATKHQLHGVIVTINEPDPVQLDRLREIAKRLNFNIYSWSYDLTPEVMEVNHSPTILTNRGKRGGSRVGSLEPVH
jgi:UDP-GlcNAc:undecaprenyl-phosphate/decaprenyl-phosphate GlcNAc-1-phosphate transferase